MHGDSGLMAMCHGCNHILGSKSRISSEEYPWMGRLKSGFIHNRHIPLVKIHTRISFNPGKTVFLAYGDQYIIRSYKYIRFTRWEQLALAVFIIYCMYLFKFHPDKFAVFYFEAQRDMVVEYLNIFMDGVFFFPGRGFHR